MLIALDATEDVINYAVEKHFDTILCHHPVFFKGLKQVTPLNPIEENYFYD